MRARDVRIGETYVVTVPQRLPSGRYPLRTDDVSALAEWQQLHRLRGSRFRLTVTALDTTATPPMVKGIRIMPGSHVRLDLTPDQVQQLGLPDGDYVLDGLLRDANGDLVELPDLSPLRVPARWIRT